MLSLLQLGSALNKWRRRAKFLCALLAISFLFACPGARAQLNANIANVNLNATLSTSLTVSASPGLVNFALVPNGTANGSSTVTITTAWTLHPNITVTCYAYFMAPGTALSDGAGDNIPSANVSGSADAGAFAPFTANSPFAAGSSLQIFAERIIGTNKTKTRSDTLDLQISTAGLALPAGTYTGVLRIQAQAL